MKKINRIMNTNNQLTLLNIGGERVLISTFFGKNRSSENKKKKIVSKKPS